MRPADPSVNDGLRKRLVAWSRGPIPFYLLLALTGIVRILAAHAGSSMGDYDRYWSQATSILTTGSYATHGVLEVSLAPGYPYFLAVVRSFQDSIGAVLAAQCVLAVLGAVALHAAISLLAGRAIASAALAVYALHPNLVIQTATVQSEPLTVCLVTALLWLCARMAVGRRGIVYWIACGAVVAALPLTAPAQAFVASALAGWALAWGQGPPWPKRLLGLAVGGMLLIVPWQLHCVRATGGVIWTLLDLRGEVYSEKSCAGYFEWVRTWYQTPSEFVRAIHRTNEIDRFPSRAFRSSAEKRELTSLGQSAQWWADLPAHACQVFAKVAQERRATPGAPPELAVLLVRAGMMWLDFDAGAVWQLADGVARGLLGHAATWLTWQMGVAMYWVTLAVLLTGLCRTAYGRHGLQVALLLGIMGYTFASAIRLPEQRRNTPLIACWLAMAAMPIRNARDVQPPQGAPGP